MTRMVKRSRKYSHRAINNIFMRIYIYNMNTTDANESSNKILWGFLRVSLYLFIRFLGWLHAVAAAPLYCTYNQHIFILQNYRSICSVACTFFCCCWCLFRNLPIDGILSISMLTPWWNLKSLVLCTVALHSNDRGIRAVVAGWIRMICGCIRVLHLVTAFT